MNRQLSTIFGLLLGLAMLLNGLHMTIAPDAWYTTVPGVADRGPFNQHFLRDIGFIYALGGANFIIGATNAQQRFTLWLLPTAWLTTHALFHIWEVIVGICAPEALTQDFAGVTIPSLMGLALLYSNYRNRAKTETQ